MEQRLYQGCIQILKEELVPALGCTEPIAIAYAAAKARDVLGSMPEHIIVKCSGNIVKNVKGVIVPTTGDMRGIETSAVLGAVAGNPEGKLEVLEGVTKEDVELTKEYLKKKICEVQIIHGVSNLQIIVVATKEKERVEVEICEDHTNIIRIEKNGQNLLPVPTANKEDKKRGIVQELTLDLIYNFVNSVYIDEIKDILDRQIKYNMKIAEEGLTHSYGANVGKTILKTYGKDVKMLAKAYPAAGSDARMGGCTLPVIINSGSGNQGMTVSLPVIIYAKHLEVSDEMLYRALAFSNLIAVHLKSGIGKLSAYCGVVSAACGSGAAITYLHQAPLETISKTITNVLGNVSGIVCDGAKSSCAAKIASAVDAAIMGHYMAMEDNTFGVGEGLVKENVELTINTICKMGRDGMKQTDEEILNLMIHS
ncbi:serine dehydratase subunit alpha family protein [Lachnoclostridium phytofermentans]|uniref:L-cysteine desulfidase family protein n=1 Tax=Lachnoclostridium phytofermentans TaxID=66219 RepID=UPI000497B985|nr:L-serine ammonia-lyase, iron-sulfur-dependent, subunit alpha [Lachnoclostridium phytofermentans]